MASFLTSTPNKMAISEIAEKSFRAKSDLIRADQSKPWLVFNVTIMAIVALDLAVGHFMLRLLIPHSYQNLAIIAEKSILVLFALNSLFLIFLALKPFLWSTSPICLTARQMKLLGVSEKSPLFTKHRPDKTIPSKDSSTLDLSWLYHVKNRNFSPNGVSSLGDSSFPGDQSFSASFTGPALDGGPPSGGPGGPKRETYAESLLRLRRARSCSPFVSSASTISNSKQLRQYLKKVRKNDFLTYKAENEPLDHRQASFGERASFNEDFFDTSALSNSVESTTTLPRNFFQPQQIPTTLPPKTIDFSNLAGQKYHVSPVVSVEDSVGPSGMGESSDNALSGGLNATVISPAELTVWLKFDIDPSKLDLLTHNSRIWISKTIFQPISAEIDLLNSKLSNFSPLTAIGSTNLSSLRQLILTQSDFQGQPQQQFSSNLSSLFPYLELSVDQAYLVSRIKALARGTCLGEYSPFSTRYGVDINDFDIVLHFLRVYLTSRLVSNPLKLDDHHLSAGGPSRFFVLYPSKLPAPAAASSPSFAHQQKLSSRQKSLFFYRPGPEPRVQIVYGGQILDVGGKGTNNLFRAFVLFVQILHIDFDSRLISLSLGPSGLNLLWILD